MIDFIKAYTIDKYVASWLRNTICTQVEVNHSTGEIRIEEYFGKCSQFKIRVFQSGRIHFSGSLHKYHSEGANHSDFTIIQLKQTIYSFCELVGIKPENMILENIEFGVNIKLPYPPSILLNSIVSLPCGELFSEMRPGEGKTAKLTEYRHKIYNKSKQYFFNSCLLRYEIHVDKMRWIYPVKTLQDLTKTETWDFLQERLVREFKKIIFTESYNETLFTKWEQNFFRQHRDKISNARYWKELEPLERHRALKWLKKIEVHGEYRFSKNISLLIDEKVNELKNLQQYPRLTTG